MCAVAGLYVIVGLLVRPASPVRLAPVAGQPLLWRGAYHVHTNRSDGSGTPEAIAADAAAAGLHFVILTDHGDGTRPADAPRYVENVLLIDGVEISAEDGHYVALGMAPSEYPLGGDGRGVAEDVRRLGGIGIVAHPDSPRPALAWRDASVPADGFEWLNADSTWRGASTGQLLTRLIGYPFNRPGALSALATYPGRLFETYDAPSTSGRLALAAVDAHARIGWRREADPLEGGRTVARFPSYRAMFGTFGVVVPWLGASPSGKPREDAAAILLAIREHRAYSAVFSMADAPYLAVTRTASDGSGAAGLSVRSNLPGGSVIRVRRNGRPWKEAAGPTGSFTLADLGPATYRAEIWLPARRGWPALPVAVGQAVAHNLPSPADVTSTGTRGKSSPIATGWHGEHDPRSSVALSPGADTLARATMTLAPGNRVSQFAALVADVAAPPPGATGVHVRLSADAPMRLSLQWREPRPGEGLRWRRSLFVDTDGTQAALSFRDFRAISPASGIVPPSRVHALLFVMDTVNARPGDRRTVTVHEARWTFDR